MAYKVEKPFRPGVAVGGGRPPMAAHEMVLAGVFYLALLVQVVLACVVFASKNSDVPTIGADRSLSCGSGMRLMTECDSRSHSEECITDSLCEELRTCLASSSSHRYFPERLLSSATRNHSKNVWVFLERYAYMPAVLFSLMVLLSIVWLLLLQRAAKPMIWGTIIADIVALVLIFIYMMVAHDEFNVVCLLLAMAGVATAVWLRDKINQAAVIMTWAMNALASNKRLFLVCGGITLLWGAYIAIWITSLISLFFVQTAVPAGHGCELETKGWANDLRWYWIANYYWTTYFFMNAKLCVLTPQIAAWYFKQPNSEDFWIKSMQWAFGPLAGGNALCSAIMGIFQYLMGYTRSKCRLILGLFNPFEWVPICIAFALRQVLVTYTKFGLIAQAYSGEQFCGTAAKAFSLLREKLGEAILCDYLGSRVMSWCTWVLCLGVAFATWAWAEDLQLEDGLLTGGLGLTPIIGLGLGMAFFISYPFITIVLIVVIESWIGNISNHEVRAWLNVVFSSLFCGSICHIILNNVAQIVVNSMDIIFFCYAVEVDSMERQDRFQGLYESIKKSIAPGVVAADPGVTVGRPPCEQVTVGRPPCEQAMVEIPHNAPPGSQIQARSTDGQWVSVVVPTGAVPGTMVPVQIPPQPVVVQANPVTPPRFVGQPLPSSMQSNSYSNNYES